MGGDVVGGAPPMIGRRASVCGFLLLALALAARAEVTVSEFGKLPDGRTVESFTLANASGLRLTVMNLGASVIRLLVPDGKGRMEDVVLGFDDLDGYLTRNRYFGSVIGRYANRIAGGSLPLDGKSYPLSQNLPPDTLHGGRGGFDTRYWNASVLSQEPPAVRFKRVSADGEEGFPGRLDVAVTYRLEGRTMSVAFDARTDKPTVFNPTSHIYFNLSGSESVGSHWLQVAADRVLEVGKTWLPTGNLVEVNGTWLDFTRPARLSDRLGKGNTLDHTFVLGERFVPGRMKFAARLSDPKSGRYLDVFTDQPGLQVYAASSLRHLPGKNGRFYDPHAGICLEPQHFPDSPHQEGFPSTVLRPGERYHSESRYEFGNQ